MKALTPQLGVSQVCGTAEVSLLISIELLNIPPPGTLLPFHDARFNTLQFSSPSSPPHRPAESFRRPESGLVWDVSCGQRFAHCSHAPRQAWPNRVHFRYGLFFRLRLLSTLSLENAVTFDYEVVTNSPVETFTQLFNRLHRRTSGAASDPRYNGVADNPNLHVGRVSRPVQTRTQTYQDGTGQDRTEVPSYVNMSRRGIEPIRSITPEWSG